jgi:transcriptional regulator with XRE-family HTH domain
MTPLDSGPGSETYVAPVWNDDRPPVSLAEAATLAEGLRAAREATGRSLSDLADATRVRREYLAALEEAAFDRLPSRPFAVGYVRAYARALGVDEETAAERFKAEHPDRAAPLQAPIGSELDDVKPSSRPWVLGAAGVFAAVLVWNVVQHAMNTREAQSSEIARVPETWSAGWVPGQAMPVGAPQPAPKDQTVPAPYITPGLETQLLDAQAAQAQLQQAAMGGPQIPVGAAFNPKGVVYGAEPEASMVTVQARKPANIVIRSADGTVYFARQLAAGEAWRAPLNAGAMLVDVSDPLAFDVFFNGEAHGQLPQVVTPLAQLNSQASQLAAAQAARQAQAVQAVQSAPAGQTAQVAPGAGQTAG